MRYFRIALIALAGVVVLLVIVVAVAFSSRFQTWAAQRALASQPGWSGSIGSVSADLKRIELKNVRLEHDGAVLILPAAEAELPLWAAGFHDQILVSRFVARGWTLDLTKWSPASAPDRSPRSGAAANASVPGAAPGLRAPSVPAPTPAPSQPPPGFEGIFGQLQLPVDLALEGIAMAGEIVLPDGAGRARVTMSGGGLAAGQEGRFKFSGDAALTNPKVSVMSVRGTIAMTMDTPRTVARIAFKGDATASGTQFPQGVNLSGELAAGRNAAGEAYAIGLTNGGRTLMRVEADFPRTAAQFAGSWKIDVRDTDIAPFTLGRSIPKLAATGEGKFAADAALAGLHLSGRLAGSVDQLNVLLPQLADVGAVKIATDFDVARRGDIITVQSLNADVAGDRPVATVRALQAFEFNFKSAELRAADPARELLGIALQGVPLTWAKPFLPDIAIGGGDLRGELVASMRAGGTWLRTTSPLTVAGASVGLSGRTLIEGLDIALSTSADYTPQGWQAEIADLTARAGGKTVLTVSGKAGQLAGKDQPLKVTGELKADLPEVLAQPVARGALALTQGEASVEFIASLDDKKEIQAKVALTNLAAPAAAVLEKTSAERAPGAAAATAKNPADAASPQKLPAISGEIRTDIAPNGVITVSAPIVIERDTRQSDLRVAGTLTPGKNLRTIAAQVTSNHLVIDDAQVLSALLPAGKEQTPEQKGRDLAPAWAGLRGTIALQLKDVVYSETFQATNVVGTLRLEENGLKLDGFRVNLGEGDARINGAVTFNATDPRPYGVAADLEVLQFDPGPLFRALNPQQAPTVEGKFNVKSQLSGRAQTLAALVAGAGGEFELTSRGGVFRGMPVNVSHIVENTSRLAQWLASAGTALGALTGKKDSADVAGKAQAVAELAKGLNPIPFDQLAVVVSRDQQLNTTLKDFTLISPEIRLSGAGRAVHEAGSSMLDDALSMEFTLRARGRQGQLLEYLGALEPQPDDLGYSRCTMPVEIGGTLGKPDASAFSNRVAALAIEKSGLADKAAEFLSRIRGSGAK